GVVGFFRGVDVGKIVVASAAGKVDAQLVLFVKGLVNYQRHTTQTTQHRVEHGVTEFQRAAQLTAGHRAGDQLAAAAGDKINIGPRRVLRAFVHFQPVKVVTHHQRLTIADGNVPHRVVLFDHGNIHQFGQVFHQHITLIQQVVGFNALGGGGGKLNLFVQFGNGLTDGVDFAHHHVHLAVNNGVLGLQAIAD